jgi:hypothetical protein
MRRRDEDLPWSVPASQPAIFSVERNQARSERRDGRLTPQALGGRPDGRSGLRERRRAW